MFGSQILEVVIGIIFVYWLLSLISSSLNEIISRIFSMRARDLERGIRNLLEDPDGTELAKKFYDHSLIRGLKRKGKNPSYIPSRTFALALMDIITPADFKGGLKKFEEIKDIVAKIQVDKLREAMLPLINKAEFRLNKVYENVEDWFNDAMESVSSWYKQKTQLIVILLALIISVAFNADTLMITNNFYEDAALRASVAAIAEEAIRQPISLESEPSLEKIKQYQEELLEVQLPLGWYETPKGIGDWVMKVLGLLLTTVAVSLGAPFWFDLLNKFVSLRPTGKKDKT